jgi:feruloyl esterase
MQAFIRRNVWMRCLLGGAVAALLAAAGGRDLGAAGAACEALRSLQMPNTAITIAESIAAGAPLPDAPANPEDGAGAAPARVATAPRAFCRVAATLKPSPDSDIKIEVWLPADWNGKFNAVGNGAFSGSIAYPAMRTSLSRGYATASTDTGHSGNNASFALGHPEKLVDFGWRAVHATTEVSKQIVRAHYDAAAKYAYWTGCSAGGRQGLMEAQRFPADFDGIVAGAPGVDWSGRAAQALRGEQLYRHDPSVQITVDDRQLLHQAALAACDAQDGLKDGLISDPAACHFDPGVLECKGAASRSCLSAAQVGIARGLYARWSDPRSKRSTGGLLPGSELGWTDLGWTASARATGLSQFRFIVFKDPSWDLDRFDIDRDLLRADGEDRDTVNALNYDIRPFVSRGGKLIQYHGWSDSQISPLNSVDYYTRAVTAMGGAKVVSESYRLFMAPGMGHCSGGEGPNTFDPLTALEQWVEQRQPPDRIVATHAIRGVADRTRPLCPYPQIAAYSGSGSPDADTSFVCRTP